MNIDEIKQRISEATAGMSWRARIEIVVLVIFCAVVWYLATPAPAPVNEWHPATPAPQVKPLEKAPVKVQYIYVYPNKAKDSLNLPQPIKDDPAKQVIEATRVQADEHPQTVTTILDITTGKTETLVRIEPLPWLAAEQHGSIGVGYGLTSGLMRGWALNAHEDLLQIKALHFGADGSLFTGGAYFAGVGVAYHW